MTVRGAPRRTGDGGGTLIGLAAGFFGGLIGLILVLVLTKRKNVQHGAAGGFAMRLVLVAVVLLMR